MTNRKFPGSTAGPPGAGGKAPGGKAPGGKAPGRSGLLALVFGAAGLIVFALAVFMWLAPGTAHRAGAGGGIGGPYSLVDGDGKPVTDASWPGKYKLVYFGYSFCPDVCPTTLNAVAAALDSLGPKADRLQPLFITVDPKRDTPEVVKRFAAAFSPRITGLTGTAAQIAAAAKLYRVYYAEHRTGPGPDDYSMDHSSILYLMAPDGSFVSLINADEPAEKMASDIARHMS